MFVRRLFVLTLFYHHFSFFFFFFFLGGGGGGGGCLGKLCFMNMAFPAYLLL